MKRSLAFTLLIATMFIGLFLFANTPTKVANRYISLLQQGNIAKAFGLTVSGTYPKSKYLEAYSPLSLGNTYAKSAQPGIRIEKGALVSKEQTGTFVYVLSSNIQNKKALSESLLEVFDSISKNLLADFPEKKGFYQYTLLISKNKFWQWRIEKDSFQEYLAEMQGSARDIFPDIESFQNIEELGNL